MTLYLLEAGLRLLHISRVHGWGRFMQLQAAVNNQATSLFFGLVSRACVLFEDALCPCSSQFA